MILNYPVILKQKTNVLVIILFVLILSTSLFSQDVIKMPDSGKAFSTDTTINLYAIANNQSVALNWNASTEIKLSHYIIQRSYDGVHYKDVAVWFTNDKSEKTNYAYTDKQISAGRVIVYYRLEGIDSAGSSKRTAVSNVRLGNNTERMLVSSSDKH